MVDAGAIAVVGVACRLPGAADADQFWRNLTSGTESVRFGTLEDHRALGVPPDELNDPNFVPVSAVLDDPECLDAGFFAMPAAEARLRDPQQYLFLELSATALQDGGYDPAFCHENIGVYAASGADAGYRRRTYGSTHGFPATGAAARAALSSRVDQAGSLASRKLNLRGPSLTVHGACSTSLAAVHLACGALRNGECDLALAGGVNIDLPPGRGYVYLDGGGNSRDGHCRAFGLRASGTVPASGGAVVALKRLRDALADGDQIRAVVLGSAVSHDGAGQAGVTAPSLEGQAAATGRALAAAGVDPRTIGYVEAHGAGTPVGDLVEVAALSRAFQSRSHDAGWCAIGTVKTNVGHLGPAAGIAGLVKTVLALEHGLLPASLNYESANPQIDFGSNPFQVNAALSRWEPAGHPRRAGVNSSGTDGTNAHVLLEEAPSARRERRDRRPVHLLQLSARTPAALATSAGRLSAHLTAAAGGPLELADVAHTLRTGRRELTERMAVVATSLNGAAASLDGAAAGLDGSPWAIAGTAEATAQVALLFPGQGTQHAGMGAQLYDAEPVFRKALDQCCALLRAGPGAQLRAAVLATGGAAQEEELRQTALAQPALFAVGYALAQLWRSWGITPAAMIGHGVGEYVAATVAGVFTLPDALHVVAARGRLMHGMPPGAMLAVMLGEDECRALLPGDLSVAAVNAPASCVVSGPAGSVGEFGRTLAAAGIASRPLQVSHAGHSPMMDPVLADLREVVSGVPRRPPQLPFLSGLTGHWITSAEATDPSYWARQAREAVRFSGCVAELLREAGWLLVECGPGRQLSELALLHRPGGVVAVPSLGGRDGETPDTEVLCSAAGRLWVAGARLDRTSFGAPGYPVRLPVYPWEREYVRDEPDSGGEPGPIRPAARREPAADGWFAVPAWRRLQEISAGRHAPAQPGGALPGDVMTDDAVLDDGYVAPRTELEEAIARIWAEALDIGDVGVTDDFFDLGGDSIVAARVIERMHQEMGLRLTMRGLLENPSVEGVAATTEQTRDATRLW